MEGSLVTSCKAFVVSLFAYILYPASARRTAKVGSVFFITRAFAAKVCDFAIRVCFIALFL